MCLDDPSLSRNHAVLVNSAGNVFLCDMSTNGTFLNNKRVVKGKYVQVYSGDVLRFGGNWKEFELFIPSLLPGLHQDQYRLIYRP
jgi:pSer/pThr/pTyr-binding forkhead associated (FHA) protein